MMIKFSVDYLAIKCIVGHFGIKCIVGHFPIKYIANNLTINIYCSLILYKYIALVIYYKKHIFKISYFVCRIHNLSMRPPNKCNDYVRVDLVTTASNRWFDAPRNL